MSAAPYLLGFDIGGTKCAVVLGRKASGEDASKDPRPIIVDKIRFNTETNKGPDHAIGLLIESARTIMARNGVAAEQVAASGISCGGPLDSRRGLVLSPPNLPGWDSIPIAKLLEDAIGVPARLQNDANACALAEWLFGAGVGLDNVIFLTFGTGMGAGLILDGRLYAGTNDLAGEVGHMRLADNGPIGFGKFGSFEGFCSGGGIGRLAQSHVKAKLAEGAEVAFCPTLDAADKLTAETVGIAAQQGDPVAREIYEISGTYLGVGLSLLIDVLNPQAIIIGSVFARQRDLLWPAAQKVIAREAIPSAAEVCRVVPAALSESIGDYAALSVAAYKG